MVTDLTYKRNGIHHPSDFNANQRFPITEKHCFGVLIHNLIKLIFYEHDNGSVKDPERAYCSKFVLMLGQHHSRIQRTNLLNRRDSYANWIHFIKKLNICFQEYTFLQNKAGMSRLYRAYKITSVANEKKYVSIHAIFHTVSTLYSPFIYFCPILNL